ncbi:MAG: DUF5320 domain-containing protein [Syntrophomonadaceae bacterium]
MPRWDGNGPLSMGPMTGRGMGMCVMGADALRRGARARRALGRGAAMGLKPAMGYSIGLGLASGLGRGIARGLGCGAVIGLGYGGARAHRRRGSGGRNTGGANVMSQPTKEKTE